ncbi:MAG TPA: tRNA (N6-isopentenyl adenosine(37)-C2)-methylthiotransferase MiaB [Vicinamibacteria bacterium]
MTTESSNQQSAISGQEGKRFFIQTFGCQMNVNDSDKVAGLLRADGYEPAECADEADVVFVNTCAVRERAAEKLYHAVGRLKRLKARKPGLLVGIGGCVAQLQGASILDRARGVDVLVGTHNVAQVPALFRRAREGAGPLVDLDRRADSFAVPASLVAHSSPVRAYVTVMEGCNHVCSFCVVPRTRGSEVCRSPREVVAEVESLVAKGYPEVMLLGQTVNAYRHDGVDFAELLARVHEVPGLKRLRFTTSHPEHVTPRLADALHDLPRVCPYLHLPVQSGTDRILESMRRGYTRRQYLETIALLRGRVGDLALSSDVIVGYPGETERDFQATVDLVDEVGFEGLFVFAYSARPGTTAFRFEDDVPEAEKRRRVGVLNARQQRMQRRLNAGRVGGRDEVLVDTVTGPGRLAGRTRHFRIVHLAGPARLLGRTVEVEITGAGSNSLTGKLPIDSLTGASSAPIL